MTVAISGRRHSSPCEVQPYRLPRLEGVRHVCGNQEVFDVAAGDCSTVKPGQAHQLENNGSDTLNALFGCSATHLTTDRTVLGASR